MSINVRVTPFVAQAKFTDIRLNPKNEGGVLMEQGKGGEVICLDLHRQSELGKYALLHRDFLRTYHPRFYTQLLALGKLQSWLCEIDEIVKRRFEFAEKYDRPLDETERTLFTEVIYNLR